MDGVSEKLFNRIVKYEKDWLYLLILKNLKDMANISATIKAALENAVLCRGENGPKESYEYAEKMEVVIKQAIKEKLLEALENIEDLEESIYDILDELETEK